MIQIHNFFRLNEDLLDLIIERINSDNWFHLVQTYQNKHFKFLDNFKMKSKYSDQNYNLIFMNPRVKDHFGVKKLTISSSDDMKILKKYDNTKYNLITRIDFTYNFQQPIDKTLLPINLKSIFMKSGDDSPNLFNQSLDNLPNSIQKIYFDSWSIFNQPINDLPKKLKYLKLGDSFNQKLDNLPKSLLKLDFKFSDSFNYPIDKLPPNLKGLYIGRFFNQPINRLPAKLKILDMDGSCFNHPIDKLPDSLEMIYLSNDYNLPITKLPKSLKYIYFGLFFNQSIDILPDKIEDLELYRCFEQPISKLPSNLKKIRIHQNSISQKIFDMLPPGIEYIYYYCYNHFDVNIDVTKYKSLKNIKIRNK